MKRFLFNELLNWRQASNRKPLILLGARQVGKTYLMREFALNCFTDCLIINFDADPKVRELFQASLEPKQIIHNLEIYYNKTIIADDTLIFFDEIQECPEALNSLKYFCEQAPGYFVTAAGSLLGVKMKHSKGFPVGKIDFLHLYPLSFFEFLLAIKEEKLLNLLQEIASFEPLPEPIHEKALQLFKYYLYIGGMPEAIKEYAATKKLLNIRKIQNAIIKAYEFDFSKHVPPLLISRVTEVWQSIPTQLAREHKKFVFSVIRSGARAREYDAAIQWLLDAGLLYRATNIATPKLPLSAYGESSAFKLYLSDVGLLGALADLDSNAVLDGDRLFTEFKGALTENFIASCLVMQQPQQRLFYWTSGNTAEIDFLTQQQNEILPLEVKSGTSKKKKSLLVYSERYQPRLCNRVSAMNLKQDNNFCNYPLYLMEKYLFI